MKKTLLLWVTACSLFAFRGLGQVQTGWVQRYSLAPGRISQTVGLALAPDGNLVIAGYGATTNGDSDYVIIKYAPSGHPIWLTRYDSPTHGNDQLRGMTLDSAGNILVTGTSKTLKLVADGSTLWSAPYGGRAVVANGESVYVTGFSEVDWATAKLDALTGTNVWVRTHDAIGSADISQALAVDANGNVYVGGFESFFCPPKWSCSERATVLRYDSEGRECWTNYPFGVSTTVLEAEVRGVATDAAGNVHVMGNQLAGYLTTKYDPSGNPVWSYLMDYFGSARAMVMDQSGNIYLTGKVSADVGYSCGTVKIDPNGQQAWLATYFGPVQGQHRGDVIALDALGNVYVVGTSPGNRTGTDIVTLKYDSAGTQLWVQRYNGPANGDDIATGIAVDNTGNVYVSGYSATGGGGTEFVTIKYTPNATIQPQPGGNMLLRFPGQPGQSCALETSTNFQTWSELGRVPADANGLFQFEDTNALVAPFRFYRWHLP